MLVGEGVAFACGSEATALQALAGRYSSSAGWCVQRLILDMDEGCMQSQATLPRMEKWFLKDSAFMAPVY
jgi:hypothetical protein